MKKIQICLSFFILIYIIFNINFDLLTSVIKMSSFSFFGKISVLLIISLMIRALRWKLLFDDKDHIIKISESFKLLLVGLSLNMVLPANLGDIAKSYFGYKWTGIKEKMIVTTIFDKLLALLSVSICGFIFIAIDFQYDYLLLLLVSFFMLSMFLLCLTNNKIQFFQKIIQKAFFFIKSDINTLSKMHNQISWIKIFLSILLSVIGWFITYLIIYYCFISFKIPVDVNKVLWVGPILTLIRLFPFTLNGIGSDEAAWIFFFKDQYILNEHILIAALFFRFISFVLPAIFGSLILLQKYCKPDNQCFS